MSSLYQTARIINVIHFILGLIYVNAKMVSALVNDHYDPNKAVPIFLSTQLCNALYGFAVRAALHHKRIYLTFMTVVGSISAVLYCFAPYLQDQPGLENLKEYPFHPMVLVVSVVLIVFQVIQADLIKKGHPKNSQKPRNLIDEEKLVGQY